MSSSDDPVAAATHPDPYPFYAGLVRERPLYRDAALGLWVASSAEAVEAFLTSDLCRVRPIEEPVPGALVGTAGGEIFRRLIRMTDGDGHATLKRAVASALETVDPDRAALLAAEWAATLWGRSERASAKDRVTGLAFDLSAHVVGDLLGVPRRRLGEVAGWVGAFVRCLLPAPSPDQVAPGIAAAGCLTGLVTDLLRDLDDGRSAGLLAVLRREVGRVGIAEEAVVTANAVGLLSQAYEATAGLVGNTLLALAGDPALHEMVVADPDRIRRAVGGVLRRDPPIQSTRRFVVRGGMIAGREVRAGDVTLVLLAAANHDPAVAQRDARPRLPRSEPHVRGRGGPRDRGVARGPDLTGGPEPGRDQVEPEEGSGCGYSLGAGAHACPGGELAVAIAGAAVRQVVVAGVPLPALAASFGYRPSANARVPMFREQGSPE